MSLADTTSPKVIELIKLLGLTKPVTELQLTFLPDSFVTINAKMYMSEDALDSVIEVFEEYELVKKEKQNEQH